MGGGGGIEGVEAQGVKAQVSTASAAEPQEEEVFDSEEIETRVVERGIRSKMPEALLKLQSPLCTTNLMTGILPSHMSVL